MPGAGNVLTCALVAAVYSLAWLLLHFWKIIPGFSLVMLFKKHITFSKSYNALLIFEEVQSRLSKYIIVLFSLKNLALTR